MRGSNGMLGLTCVVAVLVCSQVQAGEQTITLQEGPGHELVTAACAICHSLDYIEMNAPVMTRTRWEATVHKMIDKFGAPINSADAQVIVNYLSTHYAAAQ